MYRQFLSESDEYKSTIKILDEEWDFNVDDAAEYLPKPNNVNVTVGITRHNTYNLKNVECINLSDTIQYKKGYVINFGGSVHGLDFVPQSANEAQHLTIGGYNSTTDHYPLISDKVERNAIQIWKYSDGAAPQLDMCILHSLGVVAELKWCPLNFYDKSEMLGVLAVLSVTGKIAIFVVPHPDSIQQDFIKVRKPRLVLDLPRTENTCFAWGGHGFLASGTKSGNIVIWDILKSIASNKPIVHINMYNASPASIRSITWRSLFDENTIVASDLDGNVNLHDLRDPFIPYRILRVRSLYTCVAGTGHGVGFIYADLDGTTRKTFGYEPKKRMTLSVHHGLVWSIATSPHHGIMGSVSSNGSAKLKPFSNDSVKYTQRSRNPEYTLYILEYDKETNTFQFIDGIKPTTDVPDPEYHALLTEPILSLNKIVWNTNRSASGWVATGGAAGLCRLEFTGL